MDIDNTPGNPEQIEDEIVQHTQQCGCRGFQADAYREFREMGFQPTEIGFQGCKVFTKVPN